jgi:hypothetical protein
MGRDAGGGFAAGLDAGSAAGIATRDDVMNIYAMMLAIEERGVERFPLFGAEFRRIGDRETADTFDRVTQDERRHTKYCRAIGRRYAPDDATWERAVTKYRAIEERAFRGWGFAVFVYAVKNGLAWRGVAGRVVRAALDASGGLAGREVIAEQRG